MTAGPLLVGETLPNFRHLRAFESAADLRSVNQAAIARNLSQPAVSYAIKRVEDFFGVSLLVRRSSGSYLTPLGEIALARVKRVLNELKLGVVECGVPESQAGPTIARISTMHLRAHLVAADGNGAVPDESHGVSQATIHRAVRELEQIVGTDLYEQTSEGKRLSATGRELARRFRLATREIDNALEEIAAVRGELQSRISIGISRFTTIKALAQVINALQATVPLARLEIIEDTYELNLERLRSGRIDVIFSVLMGAPGAEDVERVPLFYNPYAIAARKGHPLVGKDKVTLAELAQYEWVSTDRSSPRRTAMEALFSGRDLPPVVIETTSQTAHRALLLSSDRLSLMTTLDADFDPGGPLAILAAPVTVPRPHDGLTIRKDWRPSTVQQTLMTIFEQVAETMAAALTTGPRM